MVRGLAAFALALAVGAWAGRMLPVFILSTALAFWLVFGGHVLFECGRTSTPTRSRSRHVLVDRRRPY